VIVTVYQNQWMSLVEHDAIRTDPTLMAQGIMTGIGFLGAGVIVKDGAVTLDGVIFSARGILLLAPPGCDG
jgi:putative Mg2+ transporter-C (MgtC) family protein